MQFFFEVIVVGQVFFIVYVVVQDYFFEVFVGFWVFDD